MSAGVFLTLIVSFILLVTAMILSSISASSLVKEGLKSKDVKKGYDYTVSTAVVCGISAAILLAGFIIYFISEKKEAMPEIPVPVA